MAGSAFVAVLRAINLGTHNRIAMADLRAMCSKIGLADAQTLVVSGNLVFRSSIASADQLEQLLEAASTKHLDVTTDYFVRSAKEWQAIIAANPFSAQAKSDPARMVMMCLRDAPTPAAVKALQASINGRETVAARGKQAYFVYPDGQGRSKLTIAMIEKAFGTRGTARNWNTVLKLGELAQ
jgi:uncharacterized protein (DUF1697 family)